MATKVVFVAGFGRNGGTLVDRILGEVGGIVSLGEFRFVWKKGVVQNELCNCGAPFRQCSFWQRVFDRAFGGMDATYAEEVMALYERVDRTRYFPWFLGPLRPKAFQGRLTEYTGILTRLFRAVATETGARAIVDSSKFAAYGAVLSRMPGFKVYILHLVRDSRASAYSWGKCVAKPEVPDRTEVLPRFSLTSSAMQWTYRNVASGWLRAINPRYLRIRYEDFATTPRSATMEILRFVGEDPERVPFLNERTVLLGDSHTQSGNPSRFAKGPTLIRPDLSWRHQMPPAGRTIVTAMTWPLLLRYGYRVRVKEIGPRNDTLETQG